MCERHVVEEEEEKVLAEVDVQDLPKFSVFTRKGLTVVLWRSAVKNMSERFVGDQSVV